MIETNEHRFEPQGARMICAHCGLIQHRGNEVTPCRGPWTLGGRFQMGSPTGGEDVRLGIDPTQDDIGRAVLYVPLHAREDGLKHPDIERGVITSFNDSVVWVRYGDQPNSKMTERDDLIWESEANR